MQLLTPQSPPFDHDEWSRQPYHIRAKWLCQMWAVQGYGAPVGTYAFYILKIVFYIWMWTWFASFSNDLGNFGNLSEWWFKPEALLKAIAWSMLFEALGMASGSGPLTGRYNPPVGGFLYWLRPGTMKLPFRPGMFFFGGDTRRWIDVLFYVAFIVQMVGVLVAPAVTPQILWPTFVILLLMGLTDRTMFMAARPEHYFIGLAVFLFPTHAIAASKWVWYGVWFWAAFSKLNRHFPSVISVMVSNSAVIRSEAVRRRLFRDYPENLKASNFARNAAHFGTATEFLFPALLMFGGLLGGDLFGLGSPATVIGLFVMLGFHTFITSHIPMGVPIEWNFMMVYGGFVLFGAQAAVSPFIAMPPLLVMMLLFALLIMPLAGNIWPAWISFLLGMRFYAGNWAYSIWLFKKGSEQKIADNIKTTAPLIPKQLSLLYDEPTTESILSRVIAFRLMHLHGRALHSLLPKAVDNIDDYVWRDGELVAGVVLGWNFGDGHLHNEHLLQQMQRHCNWESGEVRAIYVDPQPLARPYHNWRIFDAKDGMIDSGQLTVDELIERQPYPQDPIFAGD